VARQLVLSLTFTFVSANIACAQSMDLCATPQQILKCLHPTAEYVECDRVGPGRAKIYFKGAITRSPYQLEVAAESRSDGYWRLLLLVDTARVPANPRCTLTNWQFKQ
jgi:hypothetical protein